MISPTLILMIGLLDTVAGDSRNKRILTRVAFLAAVSVLAIWGMGVPTLLVVGCVVLATTWVWAVPSPFPTTEDSCGGWRSTNLRLLPVILLFLLVLGVAAYDQTGETATGFVVDAYSLIALQSAESISLSTVVAAVALTVFLTRSANTIVLMALGRPHQEAASQDTAHAKSAEHTPQWKITFGTWKVVEVHPGDKPKLGPVLRGGRLIGPLERLLIVVLAFSDAPEIIAALAAAKGIVRFPEIAEDRGVGSKAEEFLIGSLASWTLSVLAVLFLALVHSG
ncbi:hypothetical protein ACX80U_11710 [Arthrobacter sp. TmT3-37]